MGAAQVGHVKDGLLNIMSKGTLAALTQARDAGRGDDMVSQMVDFYATRFKT
ncbi:hypothetical protein [Planktotalea sp.]|uniref:hypothetical protein n=1 Tax=Planktotalea sp. TaxID=2029877 RepID=UPI0025FE2877|nr:hypothetical protein [Planktotalea sp.]